MHRTKTEAALAEAERSHVDDPARAELLRRARFFKASWIELAEALTRAKRERHWKRWGFDSFEAYAKAELHLKQETVDKLTGSYSFLKRRAPAVLTRDAVREPIPSYQAVDFLRRAEDRSEAPADALEAIRHRVLVDAAPVGAVSRVYRDVAFPVDASQRRARDVAGLKNVAKRLRELLDGTTIVPRSLASEVSDALGKLLDAVTSDADEAA
jgi:hypothetical protein